LFRRGKFYWLFLRRCKILRTLLFLCWKLIIFFPSRPIFDSRSSWSKFLKCLLRFRGWKRILNFKYLSWNFWIRLILQGHWRWGCISMASYTILSLILNENWVFLTWIMWLLRKEPSFSCFSLLSFPEFFINLFLQIIHSIFCIELDSLKLFYLSKDEVHWCIIHAWFRQEGAWSGYILSRILTRYSGVRSNLLESKNISFNILAHVNLWNRIWFW